jgi:hypothetical protein
MIHAEPDEPLVAFVGEFLKHFGRGIKVKLRVSGTQCELTFPDDTHTDTKPESNNEAELRQL